MTQRHYGHQVRTLRDSHDLQMQIIFLFSSKPCSCPGDSNENRYEKSCRPNFESCRPYGRWSALIGTDAYSIILRMAVHCYFCSGCNTDAESKSSVSVYLAWTEM